MSTMVWQHCIAILSSIVSMVQATSRQHCTTNLLVQSWSRAHRYSARLHETRSELKPVWNLKLLGNVVPFTWQFHCEQPWNLRPLLKIVLFPWRFHCSNFPNSKTCVNVNVLHMCKWYLLINANLINAKQMLHYWLLCKQ